MPRVEDALGWGWTMKERFHGPRNYLSRHLPNVRKPFLILPANFLPVFFS